MHHFRWPDGPVPHPGAGQPARHGRGTVSPAPDAHLRHALLPLRGWAWVERYAHDLDPEVAARAIASLERHARELGLWESNPWGNIIEDRGSQITFSALGQEAPLDAKRAWDPDGTKKAALRDAVQPDVPELDVRGGGSTSVDITTRGIDKAFGMGKLVEETGIPASEMLFIGDRLDPEGNDYPVKAAGYATRAVSGWEECVDVIDEIVASMS